MLIIVAGARIARASRGYGPRNARASRGYGPRKVLLLHPAVANTTIK